MPDFWNTATMLMLSIEVVHAPGMYSFLDVYKIGRLLAPSDIMIHVLEPVANDWIIDSNTAKIASEMLNVNEVESDYCCKSHDIQLGKRIPKMSRPPWSYIRFSSLFNAAKTEVTLAS